MSSHELRVHIAGHVYKSGSTMFVIKESAPITGRVTGLVVGQIYSFALGNKRSSSMIREGSQMPAVIMRCIAVIQVMIYLVGRGPETRRLEERNGDKIPLFARKVEVIQVRL
jgi:hypothetical protein